MISYYQASDAGAEISDFIAKKCMDTADTD